MLIDILSLKIRHKPYYGVQVLIRYFENCILTLHYSRPRVFIHVRCLAFIIYSPFKDEGKRRMKRSNKPKKESCTIFLNEI